MVVDGSPPREVACAPVDGVCTVTVADVARAAPLAHADPEALARLLAGEARLA